MQAALRSIVPDQLLPESFKEDSTQETPKQETAITEEKLATTTDGKMGDKMKALFYDGPFKVSVKETDLPKIKHPDDVIIKVTTSCICGSKFA